MLQETKGNSTSQGKKEIVNYKKQRKQHITRKKNRHYITGTKEKVHHKKKGKTISQSQTAKGNGTSHGTNGNITEDKRK